MLLALATLLAACPASPARTVSPLHYRLWTAAPQGTWIATPQDQNSDGSLRLKAPWFAAGPRGNARHGPTGALRISGRRLDGAAPALTATTREVGVPGFGGSAVWAAVITFPTTGCWSVTGSVGTTRHTFRVLVSRRPD